MKSKHYLNEKEYNNIYNSIYKLHSFLRLMDYFTPELEICEIDCVIPAIKTCLIEADNLLCFFNEINTGPD